MPTANEAIVFIPGVNVLQQGKGLKRLVESLTADQTTNPKVIEIQDIAVSGAKGKKLHVESLQSVVRTIDVYEAFWGDLIEHISQQNPFKKFRNGAKLLSFWIFSGTWRAARYSKYMSLNLAVSAVILPLWFFAITAMAIDAIGADPQIFWSFQIIPQSFADRLSDISGFVGGWTWWLIGIIFISIFPTNAAVDVAYLSKAYLQNEDNFRGSVSDRVSAVIYDLINDGRYDRITILCHSFGVVIGTHVLANRFFDAIVPIRIVTLGGPLALMSQRSKIINTDIECCLEIDSLEQWIDFHSDQDWLCANTPAAEQHAKYKDSPIKFVSTWLQRIRGKTHDRYFDEPEVKQLLTSG